MKLKGRILLLTVMFLLGRPLFVDAAPNQSQSRVQAWLRLTNGPVQSLTPEELRDLYYDVAPFPLATDIKVRNPKIDWKTEFFRTVDFQSKSIASLIYRDLSSRFDFHPLPADAIEKIYLHWAAYYRLAQNGVTDMKLNSTQDLVLSMAPVFKAMKEKKDLATQERYADYLFRLFHLIVSDLRALFPSYGEGELANLKLSHVLLMREINKTLNVLPERIMAAELFKPTSTALRIHKLSLNEAWVEAPLERRLDSTAFKNGVITQEQLKKAMEPRQFLDRSGIEEYFQATISSESSREQIAAIIDGNAELKALADDGKRFRANYLQIFQTTFAAEDIPFFIDPVLEVLRREGHNSSLLDRKSLQEIPFNETERLAWNDTVMRFSLHDVSDASQLESLAKNDQHMEDAMEFYQESVVRYSLVESPRNSPEPFIEVNQFKQSMLRLIAEMRIKNFRAQIHGLFTFYPNLEFLVKNANDHHAHKVSAQDLINAEISIRDYRGSDFGWSVLKTSSSRQAWRQVLLISSSSPGTYGLDENRLVEASYIFDQPLVNPRRTVVMNIPGKAVLVLGESDFRRLFRADEQLIDDVAKAGSAAHRFFIEGVNRDTELAHLSELISAQSDISYSALRWRLFKYIEHRDRYSAVNRNLTEWMRLPEVASSAHRLNDLRWGGWSRHPMFWRVKDIYAEMIGRVPLFTSLHSLDQPSQRKVGFKFLRRQNMIETLSSVKKRWQRSAVMISAVIITTAAGVSYSQLGPLSDSSEPQAPKSISLESDNKSEIHSFEDLAKLKDLTLYSIKPKNRFMSIPKYFNYLTEINLPLNWKAAESESGLVSDSILDAPMQPHKEVVRVMFSAGNPEPDITLETSLPVRPSKFGLPVLTPSGYRLQRLEIFKNGVWRDLSEGFLVTNVGLYYVRLPQDGGEAQPLTYRASFVKDARLQGVSSELMNLSKTGLHFLSGRFAEAGATELSRKIKKLAQRDQSVSLSSLTATFATSGFYTYRTPILPRKIFSSFSDLQKYRQFLFDGSHYYQCTGANNQYVEALNKYFENNSEGYRAYAISGFVYKAGENKITGNSGHLHTLVSKVNASLTFSELDATPMRMDPNNPEDSTLHPFSNEERKKVRSQVEIEEGEGEPKKGGREEKIHTHVARPRPQLVKDQKEKDSDEIADSETKRSQSEIFDQLRAKLHVALAPLLEQARLYQMPEQASQWGGLGFLRYLQSFSDYYRGRLPLPGLLKEILAIRMFFKSHSLDAAQVQLVEQKFQQLLTLHGQNLASAVQSEIQIWVQMIEKERAVQLQGERKLRYLTEIQFARRVQKILDFMLGSVASVSTLHTCRQVFLK